MQAAPRSGAPGADGQRCRLRRTACSGDYRNPSFSRAFCGNSFTCSTMVPVFPPGSCL